MIDKSTRRDFIKGSTALGAAWWVSQSDSLGKDSRNPLERINFACIGVNGKGSEDTDDAGRNGNIVGLCDIDDLSLEKKKSIHKSAKTFNDYREMLDQLGDKIDAVTVSTPDHSHAPASLMAMKKGKHCFTQKPLTWSLEEARRMREVAAEKKVATQMGNQGTSHSGFRTAVEVIRAGSIGDVKEVHIWTNRPIWPQGAGRPKGSDPVPKHVHWDLFLGPAPERPYVAGVYHPFKWRGWVDFGTGALGDMACHTANMAVMALELFDPTSVDAKSPGIVENETYPSNSVIRFEFPERAKLPACSLTWYDGRNYPPAALLQGQRRSGSGLLLVGDKGSLYSPNDYGSQYVLLPRDKFQDFKAPEKTLPRSPGHFAEYARACRGGEPAMSNFGYAGRLTETILLGNLALRAGSKIEWDAKNQKVTNLPDANKYVRREYRTGYSI